jgi:hypothetical protein
MVERLASGIGLGGMGNDGRPGRAAAGVEGSRIVEAVALGEQEAPVDIAEHRPDRDRAKVHALAAKLRGRLPYLREPAQLLVAVAAMMDLGDGNGDAVALPRLAEPRCEAGIVLEPFHPHRLGIGIGVAAVPTVEMLRIEVHPVVEEALRREIMVDAEDVGPGFPRRQPVERAVADSGAAEPGEEGVPLVDPAAQ